MPVLSCDLRRQLENVCVQAREQSEEAARSALHKRAVDTAEAFPHFTATEKSLRNRLRARGRQAGDVRQANKTQGMEQLAQELAYEYWHRMLFARFLAENHLLMHPDGVAVSLEECDELAKSEEAINGFALAALYASKMLPQVFRTDDVLLDVEFAPEHRLALARLLDGLPKEAFLADDSLGWVYQFWQTKRKKQVNASGQKIDGRTLPAVTQLFTDHYMVQFLLHNTVGAWWCGRHGITGSPNGAGVPAGQSPVEMEYIRWRADGTPAAGNFDGWPTSLKEFTMLDPCCGSGHFLVAAFNFLVALRMCDEGLSARQACDAVLRENLFGLELDARCTQIAAFALAVAAWKYPGEDGQPLGYRPLPALNIACTGIGPQATEDEWLKLAEQSGRPMTVLSREPILNGLRNLYSLFSDAPTLGSLIEPNQLSADLISADYETLEPYLAAALAAEKADDDEHERAVAASGMVKAAELLAKEYTLVITNVPYLGRGDQSEFLCDFCEHTYSAAKGDLATIFLARCRNLVVHSGTIAVVTPWNWLFLTTYDSFRDELLAKDSFCLVARLGERAFDSPQAAGAFAALTILTIGVHADSHLMVGLDVSAQPSPEQKALHLMQDVPECARQKDMRKNPGCVISTKPLSTLKLLGTIAQCYQGTSTGDNPRFVLCFWELPGVQKPWERFQVAPEQTEHYGGRQHVISWREVQGNEGAAIRGDQAWGRSGIAIGQMRGLPATLYRGERFSNTTPVIVPDDEDDLTLLWHFCTSPEFFQSLRDLNPKLSVDNGYVGKIGIDVQKWADTASSQEPLPEPYSNDASQWLFHGQPEQSTTPLQVAAARLAGYRWPAEPQEQAAGGEHTADGGTRLGASTKELVKRCDELLKAADDDGVVCIPAVRSESPAAERFREVLHVAYGPKWSNSLLHDLLADAGCRPGTTLDDWLRNAFFEQHCKQFHNRPFIWQVWDGHKEGFSCLLNYHKLTYKTLDNLTHAYLETWIKKQAGDAKTGKTGADLRLAAAQGLQEKLKLILAGEPPYDIFVRWKPLQEQPIGWNPDLNDGVRVNIRPFVESGILRKNPNIKWTKDRGKEPARDKDEYPWFWKGKAFTGDRVNDVHLTNADKQTARAARGVK